MSAREISRTVESMRANVTFLHVMQKSDLMRLSSGAKHGQQKDEGNTCLASYEGEPVTTIYAGENTSFSLLDLHQRVQAI
jgi:hypothetical protein